MTVNELILVIFVLRNPLQMIQTESGASGTFLKEDYETVLEQHNLATSWASPHCVFPLISQGLKKKLMASFVGEVNEEVCMDEPNFIPN